MILPAKSKSRPQIVLQMNTAAHTTNITENLLLYIVELKVCLSACKPTLRHENTYEVIGKERRYLSIPSWYHSHDGH